MIRNAGGVVTDDEIRSLAISQNLLGTEEIILIHHTDCGMLTFTDDQLAQKLQDATGETPEWGAEAFPDLEGDVRDSIAAHQGEPVHPEQGLGARVRLRGGDREAARGVVTSAPQGDRARRPDRLPGAAAAARRSCPPTTSSSAPSSA